MYSTVPSPKATINGEKESQAQTESSIADDTQSNEVHYSPIPPSKVADKGKVIAQTFDDDTLKQVMPFIKEKGLAHSLPNLQQFTAARDRPMTIEEAKLEMQEAKRLADLKAEREKAKKKIRRILTPEQLKAQENELAMIEAKRVKMMDEYNYCINFKDDPLPITKFSYKVNNVSKISTMMITRNNQPLNLKIYEKFVLKMLGFSEWLELHALGSKRLSATNAIELPPAKKKRKRRAVVIREVFVKKNIVVDGVHRNLVSLIGVVGSAWLAINEPEFGIFIDNGSFDLVFQRESEFHLVTTIQLIRIQNAIKMDSMIAREMYDKMIYVIEAMDDIIEARKIIQDKLDNMG
ncbi:hypothetical protein Tco_1021712 [Tanacetum coccineum]